MSADTVIRMNAGEKRTPYSSAAVTSGTLTISGTPTYTLYDWTDAVVTGHDAQNVTGYDQTALATVRVWKLLDSTSPTTLAAGFYRIVFSFSATKSADSLTENFVREVVIWVQPIP